MRAVFPRLAVRAATDESEHHNAERECVKMNRELFLPVVKWVHEQSSAEHDGKLYKVISALNKAAFYLIEPLRDDEANPVPYLCDFSIALFNAQDVINEMADEYCAKVAEARRSDIDVL